MAELLVTVSYVGHQAAMSMNSFMNVFEGVLKMTASLPGCDLEQPRVAFTLLNAVAMTSFQGIKYQDPSPAPPTPMQVCLAGRSYHP